MIQDLHSHTSYSFCGKDTPETLIETAISGGIELLGISDHNYGVGMGTYERFSADSEISPESYNENLKKYFEHLTLLRDKYSEKIKLLRGIEISTTLGRPRALLPNEADVSYFDFAIVEHISPFTGSVLQGGLIEFSKRIGCPLGVAHSDIFAFIEEISEEPLSYLTRMAEAGIFWELNVNYDITHGYREHGYVKRFFNSEHQQELVRKAGLRLSIGFDSHISADYLPERVRDACNRVSDLGISLIFE